MQKAAKERFQNVCQITATFLILLSVLVGSGVLGEQWQHQRQVEAKQIRTGMDVNQPRK